VLAVGGTMRSGHRRHFFACCPTDGVQNWWAPFAHRDIFDRQMLVFVLRGQP
jgi:hypothetical protein